MLYFVYIFNIARFIIWQSDEIISYIILYFVSE